MKRSFLPPVHSLLRILTLVKVETDASWPRRFGAFAVVFCVCLASVAQDLDSNVTSENRNPGKIADEISDKAEDSAFLNLFHEDSAKQKLEAAQAFVRQFPRIRVSCAGL